MLEQLPRLIIFDLDGTLVDSVPDIARAVNIMLAQLGREPVSEARVRGWIGNGVAPLVKRALTGQLQGEPEGVLFEQARTLFLAAYRDNVLVDSRAYAGVTELLGWLKQQGRLLALVTNKPAEFLDPLLDGLALDAYFDLVLGGDSLAVKKPDPGPLLHAAAMFGLETDDCLMVGDSVNDIAAAQAAGMPVAAVSYGYEPSGDVRCHVPDVVVDSLHDLLLLLQKAI